MSGSYYQLSSKYNTLYALFLKSQALAGADLQTVIDAGDNLEGVAPALNQIVKYDGTNVVWGDVITPNLQQVIDINNELNGVPPNINQTITYDGLSVGWSNVTTPTLQQVTDAGSTTTNTIIVDDGVDSIAVTPSDILINSVGGSSGQYLSYDTKLKWVEPFQSGIIYWPPASITGGSVSFPNSYSSAVAPKVYLTFNNNGSTSFVNVAIDSVTPDPVTPDTWIGFVWRMSVGSGSLLGMSISWFSVL
jgi:hypothetical protein